MLTCSTLRGATLGAILLLLAAGLVVVLPNTVTTSYLALGLLLTSVLVFAVTFLLSILPGAARRFDECEH